MTLEQWATVVQTGGVVVLLVASLFGLYRGWWVPGSYYRAKEAELAEWKAMALKATGLTEKVASAAEKHADAVMSPDAANLARMVIAETRRQLDEEK